MKDDVLIKIKGLNISFFKDTFESQIIKNISFTINQNQLVAVVGESGSGKSVTALALMGLLPKGISKITSGKISFNNKNLVTITPKAFQTIRGKEIGMVFQEPMSSLNPTMRCGKQVEELLKQNTSLSAKAIKMDVMRLFQKVKLPDPKRIYKAYPHEISGGQKQRVMIAMAIACKPKLLIADEPTTALDVTVQKDIIELLKSLQK
jgi:peptide/nickel transport system ATP-binding protein